MKIKTMRFIDYWVGRPTCFFFDCIHVVGRCLSRKDSSSKPRNILFVEFSEAGSIVLAYSALKRARSVFSGAAVYFVSFSAQKPALLMVDVIDKDKILTIRNDNIFIFISSLVKVLMKIHSLKIDTVIDLELYARFTSIVSFLSGAKRRVGFYQFSGEGLYRGRHMTHKVHYNPYNHMSKNFLSLVHALEGSYGQYFLKNSVSDNEVVFLKQVCSKERLSNARRLIANEYKDLEGNENIILMHPNAGILPIRAWPLEKYAKLAQMLLENHPTAIVAIVGLPEAKADSEYIQSRVNSKRLINLAGKTESISDIVDLCHFAGALVTNDSGPAHYATLTDAWIFTFFGPETPVLYGPMSERSVVFYKNYLCSPCLCASNHRVSVCDDNKCLQSISSEEVYLAICQKVFDA